MTVNDAVAKRITQLLAEKKMTQYRLEQQSGIQHGHMQWIMSGKSKTVTLSTVMMLANGFGMTVVEFLNDDMFLFENLTSIFYFAFRQGQSSTGRNSFDL